MHKISLVIGFTLYNIIFFLNFPKFNVPKTNKIDEQKEIVTNLRHNLNIKSNATRHLFRTISNSMNGINQHNNI